MVEINEYIDDLLTRVGILVQFILSSCTGNLIMYA